MEDVDDDDEEFEDAPVPGGATGDEAEKLSALLKIRDNLRVNTLFPHALFGSACSAGSLRALRRVHRGADRRRAAPPYHAGTSRRQTSSPAATPRS